MDELIRDIDSRIVKVSNLMRKNAFERSLGDLIIDKIMKAPNPVQVLLENHISDLEDIKKELVKIKG